MTARGVLRRAQGVSQRLIRKIAHGEGESAGALYINGNPARFRDRVKAGDEIRLVFPEEKSWIEPQEIPLSILYEDDDILVIDKQAGMVVHPTKGHRAGTVANAVIFHMKERGENYKPRFISRLDMGTYGILLIGKNSHAQDSLAKQNAANSVEKIYMAVLEGRLEDDLPASGVIDLPIGLASPGEPRRAVIPEPEGGYPSQTEYSVISGGEKTVVRVRLITGRTHQIRVHFAHFGHPVLGDQLYGSPSPLISRQALHSARTAFTHPVTGERLLFEAPLPADIILCI
jgi:23S rRNA pseudouridine1911/1915/1917 synthase